MKKCRMISIDSSTTKTAFAIFDNGDYIESDLISYSDNMDERFHKMVKKIWELLNEYKPDVLYIEDTVVTRNAQTQRFLTRLQGVVYVYCVLNDCEFNTIRPTEWRKLVCIDQSKKKRQQLKQEAIDKVKELLNIDVNDDEAESILIGYAAIKKYNPTIQIANNKS